MTENKRLIQGTYSTRRYLHSDEIFRKERNWNINLPSEREFKNGYSIITDKNDTAYSIDELVELLNEFQKEITGFESCSHNWGILYDEARNKVKELSKENKELKRENRHLKQSSTMYFNLFKELQRQMQGVKSIYDLDSKDFEDLIELSKGNVFTDEIGWIHLPIKELKE